jgi:hypothetical protein
VKTKGKASKPQSVMVLRADAYVTDAAAMATFLKPLPDREAIRKSLVSGQPTLGQIWCKKTRCEFWIACDGKRATCFTVTGLTAAQAGEMRLRYREIHDSLPPNAVMTDRGLKTLVEGLAAQVTNGTIRSASATEKAKHAWQMPL